jgi:hypothetical protein
VCVCVFLSARERESVGGEEFVLGENSWERVV